MKYIVTAALLIAGGIAHAETAFVTLEKDNALAVVDPIEGKLLKTVNVGQRPRGIAISKDYRHLYIATSDDNTIRIINSETFLEEGQLPSGKDPETFALDPESQFAYVSNEDDSLVTAIDIEQRKAIKEIPVGVEPEGITVSPDGKWVASASEATNMVHWIDRKSLEVVDNTLVDPRPRALSFTADSQQLWVTSEMAGTVTVIDVATRKIIKQIKFAVTGVTDDKIQPVGVVIDGKRQWAYVALGPANRVAVINAQTLEAEKYLLVGQRVWNLAFSPDQKRLYTTNGISNDMSIIDLEAHKVTKSVGVGLYPWGVAVKP
jgi:PQQ-dependent catabolism-associated beta-propeller protein